MKHPSKISPQARSYKEGVLMSLFISNKCKILLYTMLWLTPSMRVVLLKYMLHCDSQPPENQYTLTQYASLLRGVSGWKYLYCEFKHSFRISDICRCVSLVDPITVIDSYLRTQSETPCLLSRGAILLY